MAKRKIAGTLSDPTLPKTPITIGGKTYQLCFDLGALAEAETVINAELEKVGRPERVNLLVALPAPNLANIRILFAAALRTFHPEISFPEALMLPNIAELYFVVEKLKEAWKAAMPEASATSDPQQPGRKAGRPGTIV